MKYDITEGVILSAQKIVVYGPEGIGKSTFASGFPNPLFIDTEGSTKALAVRRLPSPTSWAMLLDEVAYVKNDPTVCDTLVIDTIDWAEQWCIEAICAKYKKGGIEDFGYGNGYVYEKEEFAHLLHSLEELVGKGVNVVLTAHAQMRKFEQPDEMGAYDRWELKLGKKTGSTISPLIKEWADMVLFANYETHVVQVDKEGNKHKAMGGKRVMFTSHHPCWDAKNRIGLPEKLDFSSAEIVKHLTPRASVGKPSAIEAYREVTKPSSLDVVADPPAPAQPTEPAPVNITGLNGSKIPQALADLMAADGITESEIRYAVAQSGYFPESTPIENYGPDFINGALIAGWSGPGGFAEFAKSFRSQFPFN